MNTVIDAAKHLGNSIIESEEYTRFQKAKCNIESKDQMERVFTFERAKKIINEGEFVPEDKVFIDAKEILDEQSSNIAVVEYLDSKASLSHMLDAINGTIAHITGFNTTENKCGGCKGCGK